MGFESTRAEPNGLAVHRYKILKYIKPWGLVFYIDGLVDNADHYTAL